VAALWVVRIDGVAIAALGLVAIVGSLGAFQGEAPLLVIGGGALIAFGTMLALRWRVRAARTGLAGLTGGYFATALTEFEVATDPCDIGATLERCANDVAVGTPWSVYLGPLVLAVLFFVSFIVEPES
jgi:hypothetical protein